MYATRIWLLGVLLASLGAAGARGAVLSGCDPPTPPPCSADGQCHPNVVGYGYYETRWRRHPYEALARAPQPAVPEGDSLLKPFDTPEPELEDKQAPSPIKEAPAVDLPAEEGVGVRDLDLPPLPQPAAPQRALPPAAPPALPLPRAPREDGPPALPFGPLPGLNPPPAAGASSSPPVMPDWTAPTAQSPRSEDQPPPLPIDFARLGAPGTATPPGRHFDPGVAPATVEQAVGRTPRGLAPAERALYQRAADERPRPLPAVYDAPISGSR
jgi:hypothetical protein